MNTHRPSRASLVLGIPLWGLGGAAWASSDPEHLATWMWLFSLPDGLLATVIVAVFIGLSWLMLLYGRGNLRPVKQHPKAAILATLGGALVGILLVLLAAGPWHAYLIEKIAVMPPTAAVMPDEDRAKMLNDSLMKLKKIYERATPATRDKALRNLLNVAEERQVLFAKMIESDPGAVLRLALPPAVLAEFPPPVTAFLEQHQARAGTLEVIYEDFPDRAVLRHFLNSDLPPLALHFATAPSAQLTGASLEASGVVLGDAMALAGGETTADDAVSAFKVLAPGVALASGDQRVLVMVSAFADTPVACSLEDIDGLMFSEPNQQSVSDLFLESSYEQLLLAGEVVGPFTLDVTRTDPCDPIRWADMADEAALASGVDVASYPRKLYVLPTTPACGQVGLGQVGGSPSRAWTFRCDQASSYAHQLGHNLGLGHAASPTSEYGDPTDVMGDFSGGLRRFNAVHQERLGWLPPEQVEAVIQGGDYRLAPLGLNPTEATAPQALRIGKPGTQEFYQVSFRSPMGFDAKLDEAHLERLTLHRYSGLGQDRRSIWVRTLGNGETFTDPADGVSITQTSPAGQELTARIDLGIATCQTSVPNLALSPPDALGSPGETLEYDVTLTNMDRLPCQERTFTLDASLPLGWMGDIAPRAVTLAPGGTDAAILTVTSAADSPRGAFGLAVTARDEETSALPGATGSAYVVTLPCVRGTPGLTLSPSSQFGTAGTSLRYALSLLNTDQGDCPPSTFRLSHALAPDWSGGISPSHLILAPGQEGSATFEATAAANANPGEFEVAVSALDPEVAGHGATSKGVYLLTGAETEKAGSLTLSEPTATATTAITLKRRTTFKLAWTAPTDTRVTGYYLWRNGSQIASVTTTSFSQKLDSIGTYNYYVLAHDAAGVISGPSNTLTVKIIR